MKQSINPYTATYSAEQPDLDENIYDKIVLDVSTESLKVYGVPVPYYDGLVLPDKEYISHLITNKYSSMTGKSHEMMSPILEGWRSCANTKGGMELSHLAFCIELALQTGARPYMLTNPAGDYLGVLLRGRYLRIYKNRQLHPVMSPSAVHRYFASLNKHGEALVRLCEKINDLDDSKKSKDLIGRTFTPEHFAHPRAIHNVLRFCTLPQEDSMDIRAFLNKMSFKQTYWSATETDKLIRLPKLLAGKEFLDNRAPILYRDLSVMLTSNSTLSTLSAFGTHAPTFSAKIGQAIQITAPSGDKKNLFLSTVAGKKKPIISSIPVYVLPLMDAVSIWSENILRGLLKVQVNNNRISGSKATHNVKTAIGASICNELEQYCSDLVSKKTDNKTKGAKRKADDDVARDRAVKRIKGLSDETATMMASLGIKDVAHATVLADEGSIADMDSEADD